MLTRAQATKVTSRLLDARQERIEEVRQLLTRSGVVLAAPGRVNSSQLKRTQDWLLAGVECDPEDSSRLLPEWYAVITDLGLYPGEVMIDRTANLHWAMFTKSRRSASYQDLVISGFASVPNKSYFINPAFRLAQISRDQLSGKRTEDKNDFVIMVRTAVYYDLEDAEWDPLATANAPDRNDPDPLRLPASRMTGEDPR